MTRAATSMVAGIVVLGLALAVAACSGATTPIPASAPSPSSSPATSAVAIDPGGCSGSGPTSFAAGQVRINATNGTVDLANFELLAIGPGGSFEELAAHVEAERDRLDAGQDLLGAPAWITELTRAEVAPSGSGLLSASAGAGTLAVVCALVDPGVGVVAGPYLVGPLEVR